MNNIRYSRSISLDSNTSVEAAWDTFIADTNMVSDCERQLATKPSKDCPRWAYWFARNVITDEWLGGEDIILVDKQIWKWYAEYVFNLRTYGMVGWTLRVNHDYKVDGFNQIVGYNRLGSRRAVERFDVEATADRIAKQMEDFRKQRKLRDLNDD